MSLNWDTSAIKDWNVVTAHPDDREKLKADPSAKVRLNPLTDALIWMCMAIGMNGITEKNVKKFCVRAYSMERFGAFRGSAKGPIYLTEDEVESHIGLRTNVSDTTDAQFAKKLLSIAEEHVRLGYMKGGKSDVA
jgi:hypothetical protein